MQHLSNRHFNKCYRYEVLLYATLSHLAAASKHDKSHQDDLRLVGGYKVAKEFSWVVSILTDHRGTYVSVCTGSLLNTRWVLSACHCNGIGVGVHENGKTPENSITSYIQFKIKHNSCRVIPKLTDADREDVQMVLNDIALFKVMPIQNKLYGKISAIDYHAINGKRVTVLGYGLEHFLHPNLPNIKNTAELHRNRPLKYGIGVLRLCDDIALSGPVFCVMRACGDVALVSVGDSGAPVLHDGKIVGINSLISQGGRTHNGFRHVDANSVTAIPVSPYLEWICKVIETNNNNRTEVNIDNE